MVRMCRRHQQESGPTNAKLAAGSAVERSMRVRLPQLVACGLVAFAVGACAGTRPNEPTTSGRDVVEMDELRITAARDAQGYKFDVYDVADLFKRATDLLNEQKCKEAVELYDRVVSEFATSRYA